MSQIPDHYVGDDADFEQALEVERSATEQAERRFFTASEHKRVVALREVIQELGALIDLSVPPGRNKALAFTALEDVQMRANRGIFAPEGLR